MDEHFETFGQVYDERFQAKYGFWRSVVERSVLRAVLGGTTLAVWRSRIREW